MQALTLKKRFVLIVVRLSSGEVTPVATCHSLNASWLDDIFGGR